MNRSTPALQLRGRWQAGQVACGPFCEIPSPAAVEIIGAAGWDFAVLDCEHAPVSDHMLPDFVRAAESAKLPLIVRVRENNAAAIQQALDSGATGVQIPQISSLDAARAAVAAARFHPRGSRGLNPFVRAASYSAESPGDFLAHSEAIVVVLQLESRAAIEAAAEIAAIDGIDVVFVGPYDLSQSLGIPGDVRHRRVMEAGAALAEQIRTAGKRLGVFANNIEDAARWAELGVTYLCYSSDTVVLTDAMRSVRSRLTELRRYTVSS